MRLAPWQLLAGWSGFLVSGVRPARACVATPTIQMRAVASGFQPVSAVGCCVYGAASVLVSSFGWCSGAVFLLVARGVIFYDGP